MPRAPRLRRARRSKFQSSWSLLRYATRLTRVYSMDSMRIACAGHSVSAFRTFAASCSGTSLTSSTTMPSSSSWSKTSPAARTQWPAPMHLSWSTCTRITASPRDRQVVHAVDLHVVLEADVVQRHRETQARQPPQEDVEGDLQLEAREHLAETLMDAVAECKMLRRVAVRIERVGILEHRRVAIG